MALPYAILGLLKEHPLTGYEIKHTLDGPLKLAWSASYGGLYPQLHRLELKGLISVRTIIQDGKPNKKVYTLTKKGLETLKNWLIKPAQQETTKNEFLLKIFLLNVHDTDLSLTLLAERKEFVQDQIKALDSASKTHNPYFDYGLTRFRNELRWIETQLKSIKRKHGSPR